MLKKYTLATFLILFAAIITGCNLPGNKGSATSESDAISTSAARTVIALSTRMPQTTGTVSQSNLPGAQTAVSGTQLSSDASLATPTTQSNASTSAPQSTSIPCDRAEFVTDVTIPDGTVFGPGETFTKTWRLKNNGSCTWNTSYKLVFDSGNAMNGSASMNLPGTVAPGDTIDLSLTLKAPTANGIYQGFWKLQNASGVNFGIGPNAAASFWVKISVGVTSSPFAVSSVLTKADQAAISTACPPGGTFKLSADIKTSAAGIVTYKWVFSDGSSTDNQSVEFENSGIKTVTYSKLFTGAGSYKANIYIDQPNHQNFNSIPLTLTCNP